MLTKIKYRNSLLSIHNRLSNNQGKKKKKQRGGNKKKIYWAPVVCKTSMLLKLSKVSLSREERSFRKIK